MVVLGKVSLNLAEMASKMESQIQRKLSVTLKMEGMNPREATLLVIKFIIYLLLISFSFLFVFGN